MDIFGILFYQPVYNLLVIFYRAFSENLGLSIILIALISRLISLPFTLKQAKLMESSKEMNERIKKIKEKYKNDKQKQQEEMVKIQSEYLPAQLSGCLPLIIQFILLINIYHVISDIILKGVTSFNNVAYGFVPTFSEGFTLNTKFLNILDLTKTPGNSGLTGIDVLPYVVVIALVALTQFYSMRLSMPKSAPVKKKDANEKSIKNKENPATEDFSEIMQQTSKNMAIMFPVMIGLLSLNFPVGLSLYWIAQSTFVIIQQLILKRNRDRNLSPGLGIK